MVKKYLSSFFFLFLLTSNLLLFAQKNKEDISIKVVQTTDVHGSIFPYDFIRAKELDYSLAHVYSFVNQERAKDNQEVIFLDNGDILQGQPVVYYSNFETPENEHVCSAIMNFMKYDAATVGNHDIEAGHAVYDKLAKEYNFPWLAANAINTKTKEPYFKPYHIINKKGVKIAVLGLITPAIPNWLPENIWSGMEFEDMVESARKWVKIIKDKENPDLLIGLFHAGVDYTYSNQNENTFKNENASKLVAQKVPGFDIIMAGHDHREYNTFVVDSLENQVLLLDPGSHARKVAVANIHLKWDDKSNQFKKELKGEIVEMKNFSADSSFINTFRSYYSDAFAYVNRTIGKSEKTFSADESLFGDSEFMDFINEVQLSIGKADISFTSPLNFQFKINKGDISVRDMFKLYRFENLLYTMKLSGQEIKDFLEYSADLWFNQMKSAQDPLLKYTIDDKGKVRLINPYYNYSSAAGIIYTVDVSKPYGNKITIYKLANGEKFKLNKFYKVAVNSYRGNGGGNHLTIGAKIEKEKLKDRIIFSTDKDLRYYIIKYIEEKKSIKPQKDNNWKIIPEEWWLKAKDKDYKLLYSK